MQTILITGTSTGIGHASAELFAKNGWTVLAGSRHPEKVTFEHPSIIPIEIDVNDPTSIEKCFTDPRMKNIDCVVNNAGYGLLLPFEATPLEDIRKLFDANVFGLMEVTRRAAKIFRQKRSGTIINISSVIGRIGAPWYAAYCGSKFAVEGFSEALSHELRPFNVHVKIVEPGSTRTEFHHVAYNTDRFRIPEEYRERYAKKKASHAKGDNDSDPPDVIARLILEAATDGKWKLRYPARQAKLAALGKRILGEEGMWRRLLGKFGSVEK